MPLEQQSRPGEETVYFFQQSPAVIKSSSLEELLQKPEECCFISVENEDYDGSAVRLPVTFSDEKWKTVQAFLFLLAGLSVSALALAGVHDRQPITSPLPDIVFTYFNQVDNGLEMSEYLILLVTYSTFTTMLFHHHRWIIFRRVFVVAGLLYLGRGVTMFVTVLPQANLYYPCAAKMNNTNPLLIARRAVSLLSGLGLSINGKLVYCGDFIYSGHTCSLVLCSLVFAEYTPQSHLFWRIAKWIIYGFATLGIFFVTVSRTHYTIDVLIAYCVTTVLFRVYHTISSNSQLKVESTNNTPNYLSRLWFFGIISYFERNTPDSKLPARFSCPIRRPALPRCLSFCQNVRSWLATDKLQFEDQKLLSSH